MSKKAKRFQKNNENFTKNNQNEQKIVKKQVKILPRNVKQEAYIQYLENDDVSIVFAVGPAGTGKTLLAVHYGIAALIAKKVDKIIITRPAVGVDDEKHGFLPGDLNEKLLPWMGPIMEVFYEHFSKMQVEKMIQEGIIELSPLYLMRGRNFKNAWVIFDESQNSSVNQMLMLLTRLSDNSKIVITGDTKQTDKQFVHNNGLSDALTKIGVHDNIKVIIFDRTDVQRHPLVEEILRLYGQ